MSRWLPLTAWIRIVSPYYTHRCTPASTAATMTTETITVITVITFMTITRKFQPLHIMTMLTTAVVSHTQINSFAIINKCIYIPQQGHYRYATLHNISRLVTSAGWSVCASVNVPLHHKVQKFSSGTSSPGWSWKKSRKTVVCVCVCVCGVSNFINIHLYQTYILFAYVM